MPGPKRKLSPEQELEIVTRYAAGETADSLARSLGIPRVTLQRTLKRAGVSTRPELAKAYLTAEQKILVAEQASTGERTAAELAEDFGVSDKTIFRILKEHSVALPMGRPPTCTLDHSAFDVITPESARWMGFLFADGCLPRDTTKGQQAIAISLGTKDRGHLELFRNFLGSDHAIYEGTNKPRIIGKNTKQTPETGYAHYRVRSNRLSDALVARGMVKNKSTDRAPTEELENNPAFWAGVVDGDGSIGITNSRGNSYAAIMLCGHSPLLKKFQHFLRRRNIADLRIMPTASGIFQIETTGSTALHAIALLYAEESAGAGLARKVLRARKILRGEKITAYEGPVNVKKD